MTTNTQTLRELAEDLHSLADNIEDDGDEQPIAVIGDPTGEVEIRAQDGYTKHGCVAFSQDAFEGGGVGTLAMDALDRFYGTMLFHPDDLPDHVVEAAREVDNNE